MIASTRIAALAALFTFSLAAAVPASASTPAKKQKKAKVITEDSDIEFKDPMVRELCLQQWGHDGHFTYADAAKVTALGVLRESDDPYYGSIQVFDEDEYDTHTPIRYFPELKYFKNLRVIGSYCFAGCDELEEIVIPESVEEIRDYAFVFNKKLKKVVLPDGVKTIGKRAFACCLSLDSISIPARATLGVKVFEHAPAGIVVERRDTVSYKDTDEVPFADPLVKKVVTETWGKDGKFTFADAKRVTRFGEQHVPEVMYDDTSFVFDEIETNYSGVPNIESFNELRYFTNLKDLDCYSFTQCEKLVEITLPESLEHIGDMAFVFCTSLKRIYIPDGVKSIDRWAFRGCVSLEEVSLPEGVKLGKGVFDNCNPGLKVIYRKK